MATHSAEVETLININQLMVRLGIRKTAVYGMQARGELPKLFGWVEVFVGYPLILRLRFNYRSSR